MQLPASPLATNLLFYIRDKKKKKSRMLRRPFAKCRVMVFGRVFAIIACRKIAKLHRMPTGSEHGFLFLWKVLQIDSALSRIFLVHICTIFQPSKAAQNHAGHTRTGEFADRGLGLTQWCSSFAAPTRLSHFLLGNFFPLFGQDQFRLCRY